MSSPITTHILDTAKGIPARAVPVTLEAETGDGWTALGSGVTDDDGRLRTLLPGGYVLTPGAYRLTFNTSQASTFYPLVQITFLVENVAQHYHVPLLLSPFGYSTYRGS